MAKFAPFHNKVRNLVDLGEREAIGLRDIAVRDLWIPRGRRVCRDIGEPNATFVILHGWAAHRTMRSDGSIRITGLLLPGDFTQCNGFNLDTIVSLTDCGLWVISDQATRKWCQTYPAFGLAIWRAKLIEEATLRKWLSHPSDAYESICHLVCELIERLRAIRTVPQNPLIEFPMTQEALGEAVDLTPVHTNRTLRRLRLDGVVEVRRGEIQVLDEEKLRLAARFDPNYLAAPRD